MKHLARRTPLSVFAAVLLTLVIASGVLAMSWSAPIPLTSSGSAFGSGVVGLDATTAVATVAEWNGNGYNVLVRRSTTSGNTWAAPQTLSTDNSSGSSAISGLDPFVDVVWEGNGRVRYTRSVDGGLTYGQSMAVSPKNRSFVITPSVARGPGGLVAIAWQNARTNVVKVTVSTDGGVTFGAIVNFPTHIQDMGTSLAVGNGVVYLAYKEQYWDLRVVTTTDGGATWSSPFVATSNAYGVVSQFSLAADGSDAYVAFTEPHAFHRAWGRIRYWRSTNSGATWTGARELSPPRWKVESPQISIQGGILSAVYERLGHGTVSVYYQQSSNGLDWTSPDNVTVGHDAFVTLAGNVIVQYEVGTGDAYVKTG